MRSAVPLLFTFAALAFVAFVAFGCNSITGSASLYTLDDDGGAVAIDAAAESSLPVDASHADTGFCLTAQSICSAALGETCCAGLFCLENSICVACAPTSGDPCTSNEPCCAGLACSASGFCE